MELIRRTDASRFSPSLAGPADFLAGLPDDLPLQRVVPLDIAAGLSPVRDVLAARHLSRLVPHPDGLVHAHGLRAAFVAALAHCLHPFPLVFTAHNLVTGGRLTRLGVRLVGSRAARVIAISQAVADGLVSGGVPVGKVIVIPNGVDAEHFAVPFPSGSPLLGRGGLPSGSLTPPLDRGRPGVGRVGGGFVVGCVARLSPEKGVDVLLQAAAMRPDMAVLIAGDGPERQALHQISPSNVRWLGRVPDTREVYAAADVVAVPSRQEGQGIVVLEAMAAGVPVVASRVGGLAEMLTDGETALLVPPDEPGALAAALARLRDEPALRERLSKNGRALVREKYDVRRMVRAVEEVYGRLIGPTP